MQYKTLLQEIEQDIATVLKTAHHGSRTARTYMSVDELCQDVEELRRLRSELAHENAHVQLVPYQLGRPPAVPFVSHNYRQWPIVPFLTLPVPLRYTGGAAATTGTVGWPCPVPTGAAPTMASGAGVAGTADTGVVGPIPSYGEPDLSFEPSLPGSLSVPNAVDDLLADSVSVWQRINRGQTGLFGALVPPQVTTDQRDERGLTYHPSNELISGVMLALQGDAASSYRDGLLRLVDGIRAVICWLLVLVLAALTRRPDVVAFLLVLLAARLRFGRRGESDDHVLPALRPASVVVGETIGIA